MDEIKQLIAALAAETLPLSIPPTELAEILNRLADYLDDSLAENYKFVGIATQSSSPVESEYPVFYLAGAGAYPNYGNTVVKDGCLGVFSYNSGRWRYSILDIASSLGRSTDSADSEGSAFARIAYLLSELSTLQNEPSLHDLWLKAGATHQAETDTYTLNGLAGLTKDDIMNCWINRFSTGDIDTYKFAYRSFKTNFPVGSSDKKANSTRYAIIFDYTFYACNTAVVIKVSEQRNDLYGLVIKDSAAEAFSGCVNLRTIIGQIICANKITFGVYCFRNCSQLMDVRIAKLQGDISFADSPLLTVKDSTDSSLGYMVENAANTEPITITLHPDAFLRLEESLVQKAQEKQISIASA